jgi:lipid II:glycine glycyltransferase (peptidoglycan interpeptide bridge formation enzyme)
LLVTHIAAILTLRHRSTVIYKYGCSDEKFHYLGAMPFLFWRLTEESKTSGAEKVDFGRSDLENQSLVSFKDRFGTRRKSLTYYRYPKAERREVVEVHWLGIRQFFSILPDAVLSTAGRVLYRHLG